MFKIGDKVKVIKHECFSFYGIIGIIVEIGGYFDWEVKFKVGGNSFWPAGTYPFQEEELQLIAKQLQFSFMKEI